MMVDALAVCLPDDPQGNAKLMFSILDCLPKVNRVRICEVLSILIKKETKKYEAFYHDHSDSNNVCYWLNSAR